MTNIQDDQLNVNSVSNDDKSNNHQAKSPTKNDVEELLNQLEALNKEIAAKTVVDNQTPVDDQVKADDQAQIDTQAPVLNQDSVEKPKEQQSNADLDKFINELEAKIAQKNNKAEVQASPATNPEQVPNEELAEVSAESSNLESAPSDLAETVEVETVDEHKQSVEENFNKTRPSLDLSGVTEQVDPSPVLNEVQSTEKTQEEVGQEPINQELANQEPANQEPANQEPANQEENADPDVKKTETQSNDESLESQNLFTMLALEDLSEEEKQDFLQDLEQLIWDNFIEVELPLLLSNEEKQQADQILAEDNKSENERKEALLVYLENFVPNLKEMMYKKALTLKQEMFEERLKKLRTNATENNNLSLIADLDQAQELTEAGRYKTAVQLLNKA